MLCAAGWTARGMNPCVVARAAQGLEAAARGRQPAGEISWPVGRIRNWVERLAGRWEELVSALLGQPANGKNA